MVKKSLGVTLVEVMLVIVILATLTLYGFAAMRNRSQLLLERTAAVEIKNLLEAALAYYADHQQWPKDLSKLWNTYLPQSAQCSPWPGSQEQNQRCPGKKLYQGYGVSRYFTVSIDVASKKIARQLASRLPGGKVEQGSTVSAQIRIPGSYHGWFVSAGLVGHLDKIPLPQCPEGYEGHYIEVPQYQTTGDYKYVGSLYGVDNEIAEQKLEKDGKSYFIKAFQKVHSPDHTDDAYSYYLTFCVPVGQWVVDEDIASEDSQNDQSWQVYNGLKISF